MGKFKMNPNVIGAIVFLLIVIVIIVSVSSSSEEKVETEEEEKEGGERELITVQSANVSLSGGITRDCQGSWGNWGSCSKLCGTGKKERRYRITRTKLGNGAECPHNDGDKEEKPCNNGACVACQGEWSEWGDCSQGCGGGTQSREYRITRAAGPGGPRCPHNAGEKEERTCNNDPCVACQGDWSAWSECSEECGGGNQRREYTITREAGPGGASCPHNTGDSQEQSCNNDPCVSCQGDWGEWGECSEACDGGTQRREYRITRAAGPGGESCPHNVGDSQEQSCNQQTCRDCQGTWTTIGDCSVPCGGGTKLQRYEINDEGDPGGTPCGWTDGQLGTIPCNTQVCSVNDAVDVDDFKNKFCGKDICNTDYPGWFCSSSHHIGYGNGGAYKDTFEECKESCASKYPNIPGLVAAYVPSTSTSNPKLCSCRAAECMDAPPADDPNGVNDKGGRFVSSLNGILGYAHCSSC